MRDKAGFRTLVVRWQDSFNFIFSIIFSKCGNVNTCIYVGDICGEKCIEMSNVWNLISDAELSERIFD